MIYHLILSDDWQKLLNSNKNTYKAPSLKEVGFIHCSTKDQLVGSANLYFGEAQEVVVLGIVEKRIRKLLKWELSRKEELFPHIYGALPIEAIDTIYILSRNEHGEWELDF